MAQKLGVNMENDTLGSWQIIGAVKHIIKEESDKIIIMEQVDYFYPSLPQNQIDLILADLDFLESLLPVEGKP